MNMKFITYNVILLFAFLAPNINAESYLKDKPEFEKFYADSIIYTLMPEGIFSAVCMYRDEFEREKENPAIYTPTILLKNKDDIADITNALMNSQIESILSYKSNEIVKKLDIVKRKKGFTPVWRNEDTVDVRCRVFLYKGNEVIVIWLADTGVFDIDRYRCYNPEVIKKLRQISIDIGVMKPLTIQSHSIEIKNKK